MKTKLLNEDEKNDVIGIKVKAKAKTKVIQKETEVVVDPILIATMRTKIIGQTSILLNKMSDKDKNMMLDKQKGLGVEKNKIRNPEEEVENKIHKLPNGKVGIPIYAIKMAMIESAPILDMYKKDVRGGLFIIGEENDLVELKYKSMVVNEAITKDSGISKAPRTTFRPEFKDWSCEFTIKYNAKQITPSQIMNLLKVAGFHIGLGSWRPMTSGSHGTFTVA